MFSYFKDGINDTSCVKFIDLSTLVGLIKNNPEAEKITQIRNLRNCGDSYYKQLKKQLPYITPNCLVNLRSLDEDNFRTNFIRSSGYIYFDIDTINPDVYKDYFIKKYGHLASLVCLSSSQGGISVLFKIRNEITNDNFELIRNQIINTILIGEPIDNNAGGFGRAMFISSDAQVYVNYENEIEISVDEINTTPLKKEVKQSNSSTFFTNILNSPFSVLSIDKVYEKLHTCTQVEVINPVVDFKPVEFVEVYIPEAIKDGSKHIIYQSMIHHLVHLNPDLEKEYIFSFLFYVNNVFARPRMERKELTRFFNLIYNGIKKTGNLKYQKKTKYVHFNGKNELSTKEKLQIANTLNGYHRRNISIQKIQEAKQEIKDSSLKITQARIAEITKLSAKTVRTHLNSELIDMNEMVKIINDSIFAGDLAAEPNKPSRPAGKVFNGGLQKRKDKDPIENRAHPTRSIRVKKKDDENDSF